MPPLDYHSLINVHGKYTGARRIIDHILFTASTEITLGSRFGSEGEVPCVTWYFSGWGGGLQGDGVLDWSGFLCGVGPGLSGDIWAEVGQRQGDGSYVVDSQQDLQGADLFETLICQRLACPLDLLDARRERTHPTSWREEREDSCC